MRHNIKYWKSFLRARSLPNMCPFLKSFSIKSSFILNTRQIKSGWSSDLRHACSNFRRISFHCGIHVKVINKDRKPIQVHIWSASTKLLNMYLGPPVNDPGRTICIPIDLASFSPLGILSCKPLYMSTPSCYWLCLIKFNLDDSLIDMHPQETTEITSECI